MWVIRQMSKRGDRRGPRDQEMPALASDSPISMQAQRNAWHRMSQYSEPPLTTPTSTSRGAALPGDHAGHADHSDSFDRQRRTGPGLYPIQFKVVSIPYKGDNDPPLSWKLSSDQMRTYSEAWKQLDKEASEWSVSSDQDWDDLEIVPPLKVIEQWLGPPGKDPANWTVAGRPTASQTR